MRTSNLLAAAAAALWLSGAPAVADAPRVKLRADPGQSAIVAGARERIYLRVDLEGMAFARREYRAPLNVALVIDRSGSMRGEKLANAREAAILALGRLGAQDRVAVVAYDHNVDLIVPSSPVTDHGRLRRRIGALHAGGRTALYAGVEEGLRQVGRALGPGHVNRIVLLSDGLANVGPSSPTALGELGRRAAEDGISVTTIGLGLGYNEDLMTRLAYASDGNHAFVEHASDLVRVFNEEFGDALSVVAQDVEIDIHCPPGIRPMRALGRKAEIRGNRIAFRINQLYGGQRKYALVELEIEAGRAPGTAELATVSVAYRDMATQKRAKHSRRAEVRLTRSRREAEASLDREVMTAVATQTAVERNERAVSLRDEGRSDEARRVLRDNAAYLAREAKRLGASELSRLKDRNLEDARKMAAPGEWTRTRKSMRRDQYRAKTQQRY